MGLADFWAPTSRRNRTYTTGQLLNDQTAGSAADVQRQASAQFVSSVESRDSRIARRAAETSAENSRAGGNTFEARTGTNYNVPPRIYG
jgi:hypothetical protein